MWPVGIDSLNFGLLIIVKLVVHVSIYTLLSLSNSYGNKNSIYFAQEVGNIDPIKVSYGGAKKRGDDDTARVETWAENITRFLTDSEINVIIVSGQKTIIKFLKMFLR